MKTLFESVARNRPEWLAQGLFAHAMRTQPPVRAMVAERLGLAIDPARVPEVDLEEVTDFGWRADVRVLWTADSMSRLELKLLAGFTPVQEKALRDRRIDGVVLPRGRKALTTSLAIVEWPEIAYAVRDDPALKQLLGEVAVTSTWLLEEIGPQALDKEFGDFVLHTEERQWPRMYRFLGTVHEHLLQGAPERYRAADRWTPAWRRAEPYYGFCFWMGEHELPRFWMGFTRAKGKPHFELTIPSEAAEPVLLEIEGPMHAAMIAERVLTEANRALVARSRNG